MPVCLVTSDSNWPRARPPPQPHSPHGSVCSSRGTASAPSPPAFAPTVPLFASHRTPAALPSRQERSGYKRRESHAGLEPDAGRRVDELGAEMPTADRDPHPRSPTSTTDDRRVVFLSGAAAGVQLTFVPVHLRVLILRFCHKLVHFYYDANTILPNDFSP